MPIQFRQATTSQSDPSLSQVIDDFIGETLTGSTIVFCVIGGSGVASFYDDVGNSYTLGLSTTLSPSLAVNFYYCVNATAMNQIIVNSYTHGVAIIMAEYPGISGISGSVVSVTGTTGTTISIGEALSQVTDFLISFYVCTNGVTNTISASVGHLRQNIYTIQTGESSPNNAGLAGLVDNMGSGTVHTTVTVFDSQNWIMFGLNFKSFNPHPPHNKCAEFWG